ncbi:hypothetical protein AX774_g2846 [Zancudomyces culisetae]|uniref:Secreted protein n=1 Tax=Zancudomyces culisetae TaxID=1213189 RepID=A0A1R1PIT9_ZANCU|nr:hypothetical protein AX774_g5698 [Zancudomyces culisetae]OMH83641.1 hypothetical protein AX774_g2846 [Zancudomyces culisetae]|eukprot:OMH80858.1 hypothetical protein AX774_g5698 [Zancudomyces culisetae]
MALFASFCLVVLCASSNILVIGLPNHCWNSSNPANGPLLASSSTNRKYIKLHNSPILFCSGVPVNNNR